MTVEAVKELARLKDNKICFDCGLTGPHQNVCLSYNIFVCTVCAGVHRSFHHIVKTLNMATFSSDNVESLKKGGNRRARKHWLANYDPTEHPVQSDNPHSIKLFIKQCFEEAKWVHKEGDPKKKKKKKDKGGDEAKTEKKKKKKKKQESDDEGEIQQEGQFHQHQPQHQPQHPQSAEVNLMDLLGGNLSVYNAPSSILPSRRLSYPQATSSLSGSTFIPDTNFYSSSPIPAAFFPSSPDTSPLSVASFSSSPPSNPLQPTLSSGPLLPPSTHTVNNANFEQATQHLKNSFARIRHSNSHLTDEQWKNCVNQALTLITNESVNFNSGATATTTAPPTTNIFTLPPKPKEDVFADLMGETEGSAPPLQLESAVSGRRGSLGGMDPSLNNTFNNPIFAPSSLPPTMNASMLRNPFLPANLPPPFQAPNPFLNLHLPSSSATLPAYGSIPSAQPNIYHGPTLSSPSLPLPSFPAGNPFLPLPFNPSTASRLPFSPPPSSFSSNVSSFPPPAFPLASSSNPAQMSASIPFTNNPSNPFLPSTFIPAPSRGPLPPQDTSKTNTQSNDSTPSHPTNNASIPSPNTSAFSSLSIHLPPTPLPQAPVKLLPSFSNPFLPPSLQNTPISSHTSPPSSSPFNPFLASASASSSNQFLPSAQTKAPPSGSLSVPDHSHAPNPAPSPVTNPFFPPSSLSVNPFLPSSSSSSTTSTNSFQSLPPSIPTKPPPPVSSHLSPPQSSIYSSPTLTTASTTTAPPPSSNPFDSITTPFVHAEGSGDLDVLFGTLTTETAGQDVFSAGNWGDFAASGLENGTDLSHASSASKPIDAATSAFRGVSSLPKGFRPPPPSSPPPVTFPSGSIPG